MKQIIKILAFVVLVLFAACSAKKVIPSKEPQKPQITTLQAQPVRFTINYAERTIAANGSIAMVADSVIVISVQPVLGIELLRAEVNQETVTVIDKMNRRYVQMTYPELAQYTGFQYTYKDVEHFCTAQPSPLNKIEGLKIEYLDWTKINGIDFPQTFNISLKQTRLEGAATIKLQRLVLNEPVQIAPLNLSRYQKTTLNALLSK